MGGRRGGRRGRDREGEKVKGKGKRRKRERRGRERVKQAEVESAKAHFKTPPTHPISPGTGKSLPHTKKGGTESTTKAT